MRKLGSFSLAVLSILLIAGGVDFAKNTAHLSRSTTNHGVVVGNETAARSTAIDENASVASHVSEVINVKAPPYSARGDGATDDTKAIQSAITAACGMSAVGRPQVPTIYLPATPGSCYKITAPILLTCSARLTGADWNATSICQNFNGPSILAQASEVGWKPPLASSVIATWQARHSYPQWWEIRDPNGNVEVATTNGFSKSSQPAWPTKIGHTVTDGGVTWQLAMTGSSLASGNGAAYDAVFQNFFPESGYGTNPQMLDLSWPGGANDRLLNGMSTFTFEFYINVIRACGENNCYLVGMEPGQPEANNTAALRILLSPFSGRSCTSANPCWTASADIGGSQKSIGNTNVPVTLGTIHHVALTYDRRTLRLFVDGGLVGSVAASGSLTTPLYESFMLADKTPDIYPGMDPLNATPLAYYDSLRISNTARYKSNFKPPTAKLANDGDTKFLLNFPTQTPTGTLEATVGHTSVFIPVETSNGAADLNAAYIGNLELAPPQSGHTTNNGIYANWMLNSTIENVRCDYTGTSCIYLHDNDYQDTISEALAQAVPDGSSTRAAFIFANQSNNNLYYHLHGDGVQTTVQENGGSGTYVLPDYSDRGTGRYIFVFNQAQALLISPTTDNESSNSVFLADIYSWGAYAPVIVCGGQLVVPNRKGAHFAINGGQPFEVIGSSLSGPPAAEVLNVLSNPTAPTVIRDSTITAGTPLTNPGKNEWALLENNGALYSPGISVTTPTYTIAAYDRYDDCKATRGQVLLKLPAASGSGRLISFKKTDPSANACIVTAAGSDKVDGAITISLTSQYAGVTVRDAGTGVWDIVK